MKTLIVAFILVSLGRAAVGGGLTGENYATVDKEVSEAVLDLQKVSEKEIDAVLGILNNAFKANSTTFQENSETTRQGLIQQGEQLKKEIAQSVQEITALRKEALSPAIVILEFSKIQSSGFGMYKFTWMIVEAVDAANAISKKANAEDSQYLTTELYVQEMIQHACSKRIGEIAVITAGK